ncbi:MAG TPA: nucleoside hydrolase [Thermoanaerobaculia bacterium]
MILIDTDNAMGSRRGTVDDAFAIAALLRGGADVAAISATAGNTSELLSYVNTQALCRAAGREVPLLRAAEARERARTFTGRIAALGPLTNLVEASRAQEIAIVGGNLTSAGTQPPFWPHEFNLTRDRDAAHRVFELPVPLTIFPLDVCRRLSIRERDLDAIPGALGRYMRRESRRWFRHLLLVRRTRRFAIHDLAAALYLLDPTGFELATAQAWMRRNTYIEFDVGNREVQVCVALDRDVLWERFVALMGE